MSKLFKTICALFFIMTWQLAGAEAITNIKEGDKVSDFVTFNEKNLFSNKKKADIPLPPGEWTVRIVDRAKSLHSDPVSGVTLILDKVRDGVISEYVGIDAYDQNQKNWNATCEPGLSHQPILGGVDSECFTLDLKTFMSDSAAIGQTKLRKKWYEAGISWGGNAFSSSTYIMSSTFGQFAVYYSIPTGRFLDDSKTARESPLHSSKLNNADEKVKSSLPAIRDWYQDYFKRVKEGVYKAKDNLPPSRLSAGMRSVVPDIEKLAARVTGVTNAVAVAEVSPKLKVDTPVKKVKNLLDLLDLDNPNIPVELEQSESIASDEIGKGLEQLRIMNAEQEKLTQLAEEAAKKEKEKQRALEAERKQAAELQAKKDAEKQLALETEQKLAAEVKAKQEAAKRLALEAEQKLAAELQAKREAENPLIRIWKDAGFEVGSLPSCPKPGDGSHCLSMAGDNLGNEYAAEFKKNKISGRAVISFKNGNKYVGEYDNGLNGQGIFYYGEKNKWQGWIFVGDFKNGLHVGNGIMFDKRGIVVESGIYEGNLKEYKRVNPSIFSRIPAGKIPVIRGQSSVSGTQSDDNLCADMDPRMPEKKCLTDPEEFVVRKTRFEHEFPKYLAHSREKNDGQICEAIEDFQTIIKFSKDNSIKYRMKRYSRCDNDDETKCQVGPYEFNHYCTLTIESNNASDFCSPQARAVFFPFFNGAFVTAIRRIDSMFRFDDVTPGSCETHLP